MSNFPQIKWAGSDKLFIQFAECQFYRMIVHSVKLADGLLSAMVFVKTGYNVISKQTQYGQATCILPGEGL